MSRREVQLPESTHSRRLEERQTASFPVDYGALAAHPRTEVLQKQNELDEYDRNLHEQKALFRDKMIELDAMKKSLEVEERNLQKEIMKQSGHIQSNEEKRQKAMRKADDQDSSTVLLQQFYDTLKESEGAAKAYIAKEERTIQKLLKFAVYLDKVVDESEAYTEVNDIIDRHNTLQSTYQELLKLDREHQDSVDEKRKEFAKLKEKRSDEVLAMTNEMATLQMHLDKVQATTSSLEGEWQHVQNTAAKQTLMLGQLKLATTNLYGLINRHLKSHRFTDKPDFMLKLDRIQTFIEDLTDVVSKHSSAVEIGSASSLTMGAGRGQGHSSGYGRTK